MCVGQNGIPKYLSGSLGCSGQSRLSLLAVINCSFWPHSHHICLSNLWEMELSGQILVKAYQTINLAADPSPAATNPLKSHLPQEKEALRRTWKTLIKTSRPISVIPIRPIVKPLQVRIQSPKFEIYCTKLGPKSWCFQISYFTFCEDGDEKLKGEVHLSTALEGFHLT